MSESVGKKLTLAHGKKNIELPFSRYKKRIFNNWQSGKRKRKTQWNGLEPAYLEATANANSTAAFKWKI